MRIPLLVLLAVFAYCQACTQSHFHELELLSVSQLKVEKDFSLEPSGIAVVEGKTYINSDEQTDNFLYQITFGEKNWYISDSISLEIEGEIDLEAIDYCNGQFFIANEKAGQVLVRKSSGKVEAIEIDFGNEKPWEWKNAGLEGLAIDCSKNIAYLIKERHPRKILTLDLQTKKLEDIFNIPETESNDFSDAKFENGFLYLLERNGNFITKIDPDSHKVIQKVSYRQTCSHQNGKLYAPYEYGMAEALYLNEDEIWLGLDNNIIGASDYGKEKYGLSGSAPVFIKFKRPKGF